MTFKKLIFLTLTLLITRMIFSDNNKIFALPELINSQNLRITYNSDTGKIVLTKNDRKITLLSDSPYMLLENNLIFTNEFLILQNGVYFITEKLYLIIKNYFTSKAGSNFLQVNTQSDDTFFLDKPEDRKDNSVKTDEQIKNDSKNIIKEKTLDNKDTSSDKGIINQNKNITNNEIVVKDRYLYEKESSDKIMINAIIIDPGHGGTDPGAIGHSGTKEKDITLKASLILYDKLTKLYPDKKIILTRNDDSYITLEKRSQTANFVFNKYGPSLFISIHVNASKSDKSYGFETWYLVEQYRRSIVKSGVISNDADVENVLNSMLNDEIYKESKFLADKIQFYLNKEIGHVSMDRGIKEQTYFVIKKSIMPAVLVEIGFNTNKYEEIRLTKSDYLNKITEAAFCGVKDFIKLYEQTNGYTK